MLDCRNASQLISKSLDRQLTWRERFAVRLHLLLCKYCSRFNQQLLSIKKGLLKMTQSIENDANIQLPSATKKRLIQSIESAKE